MVECDSETGVTELVLSVIIPVRNAGEELREQLKVLGEEEYGAPWEILIADNGSTDTTPQIVSDFISGCSRARSIELPEATNASQVRNAAVPYAGGRALAFLDADDVIEPGWVKAMGESVEHHPLVSGRVSYQRLNPDWLIHSRSQIQSDSLRTVFGSQVISIGNAACQRWLWEHLGGLDPELAAGESSDFSIRAHREMGVEAAFVPSAILHYRLRSRPPDVFRQAFQYGFAETLLYARYGRKRGIKRTKIAIRAYGELLLMLFLVPVSQGYRARFSWLAGKRVGRLLGSIRYGVILL